MSLKLKELLLFLCLLGPISYSGHLESSQLQNLCIQRLLFYVALKFMQQIVRYFAYKHLNTHMRKLAQSKDILHLVFCSKQLKKNTNKLKGEVKIKRFFFFSRMQWNQTLLSLLSTKQTLMMHSSSAPLRLLPPSCRVLSSHNALRVSLFDYIHSVMKLSGSLSCNLCRSSMSALIEAERKRSVRKACG